MGRIFRKPAVKMTFIKDEDSVDTTDPNYNPFEQVEIASAYAEVAKDFITHTAVTVTAAFVVCKLVERICR